ncbi:uncharacterized protein LOC116146288 [Pistacia vera]|uniref:uncharacterized protein LOC116146288 n=1 Tax=Pistacia vera TaxID=55513 RepID=UPI0012630F0F|nr:uncharacterized protein LOC116146288 [Pistacia vera]XP_031287559.1 uncharacterized protein LOC116146288 [Pistacia vera]
MCGSSTLINKSDYKAFKFSENFQEMRALKRDTERNLEIQRRSSDGVVEKVPQVNEFMAWRDQDQLQAAPCATSPSRTEENKERKKYYTKMIMEEEDSDTPELVAFFQEHSYQFVKSIFMDGEMPPLNKCLVGNCEMNHKMLNSDVDKKSESTKGTLEIMSSLSNEPKLRIENDSNKDVINKYESKNLKMEDGENTDARDVRLLDCSVEKIVPAERELIEKVASREADFGNSMVQSAIEVTIDNNSHTSNASSESEESRSISHNSDSPITTINGEEEFQQHAYSQHLLEAFHASKPQNGMSETNSNQDSSQQHDQEESNFLPFEQTLYSGSISCQSNSSNASSSSFMFPILPSEWSGSPVRMAKTDRRQFRKRRSWKKCFLCRKF